MQNKSIALPARGAQSFSKAVETRLSVRKSSFSQPSSFERQCLDSQGLLRWSRTLLLVPLLFLALTNAGQAQCTYMTNEDGAITITAGRPAVLWNPLIQAGAAGFGVPAPVIRRHRMTEARGPTECGSWTANGWEALA